VQLREKQLAAREFYAEVLEALMVARRFGARLIVNDRVDLALATGADGVHLGQDDMPPEAARALLGAGKIVGFSTHSVEQASAAARLPVDYIAIGPVFDTSSKEKPDPVVGLEGVRRVRAAIGRMPLVAIGGIKSADAPSVLAAGADSIAVIGALLDTSEPAEIARRTQDFLARL
jgi:thiamine-phosphate pyrophosphorylase